MGNNIFIVLACTCTNRQGVKKYLKQGIMFQLTSNSILAVASSAVPPPPPLRAEQNRTDPHSLCVVWEETRHYHAIH